MLQVSCQMLGNVLMNKIVLPLVKCMFCWKGDEQHKNESVLFQGFFFLIFKIIVETDLVEKKTLGLIHVLNIVFEMIYTTIL